MANQGNGGIFSKFQERLRKIRLSRIKKKRIIDENDNFIKEKVNEIREVIGTVGVVQPNELSPDNKVKRTSIDDDITFVDDVVKNIRETASDRDYGPRKPGNIKEKNTEIDISKVNNKDISVNDIKEEVEVYSLPKDINNLTDETKEEISLDKVLGEVKATADERKYPKKRVGVVDGENKNTLKDSSNNISNNIKDEKDFNNNNNKISRGYSFKKKYFADDSGEFNDTEREEYLEELGKEIIDRIKDSFEDYLDELDILMSELYFLECDEEQILQMKEIKELKQKINDLIVKINDIIEQYNLYKRNYYIDNLVGIDDNVLVNDIIDYRNLLDSASDEKRFVKQYKALDEFQNLYQQLNIIRDDTINLRDKTESKIYDFSIRDKKYDDIKLGMVRIVDVIKDCSYEIERQNNYYNDLISKINVIDKHEYVTRHMEGLNELLGQSLRFVGLLMLSPLRGIVPGIATQTMATRRMIGNVYQHMHLKEVRHVHYQAIDYDSELSNKITDINYTANMIQGTLYDIERLKSDFLLQYDSRIPGYSDTLDKIEKIKRTLIRSQNCVEKIENRLKKSKRLNEIKLKKVKELNRLGN